MINDYKKVDGKALGEKNPKWLQNDYVKFFRFAQWKIQQAGRGVVGMITDHSYLDNPTFRGMRRSLMGSFDDIYILDLHGNARKRETCPDGSPDKNVFDILQGVAIAFLVKRGNSNIDGQDERDGTELHWSITPNATEPVRASMPGWTPTTEAAPNGARVEPGLSVLSVRAPRRRRSKPGIVRFISVPEGVPRQQLSDYRHRPR